MVKEKEMAPIIHCSEFIGDGINYKVVIRYAHFLFLPSETEEHDKSFVCFGFRSDKWSEGGGGHLGLMIEVFYPLPGENHYDLILEGNDLVLAKVGIRPWRDGRSNPKGTIYRGENFIESKKLHKSITVVHGWNFMDVFDSTNEQVHIKDGQIVKNGCPLMSWFRDDTKVTIYGNKHITRGYHLFGHKAIQAMIEGLQLVLSRMPQEEND